MKNMYRVTGLLIFLFSCEDSYNICDLPRGVSFQAGFYKTVNGVQTPAVAPEFSLSLIGSSTTPIYGGQLNVSRFGLSLNPQVDTARYFIKLGPGLAADTITLFYASQSILLSEECGNVFVHNLTGFQTTYNTIDSIKVPAPAINTTSGENVKIFF